MNTPDDFEVINAMVKYGGGFAKRLGEAARHADGENLRRIKTAWPDYWAKYTEVAKAASIPLKPSTNFGEAV